MLLSLLPEHVRMQAAVKEYPAGLPGEGRLGLESFAWVIRDLSRSGTLGDPTVATKEKGDRLLASLVDGWVQMIEDLHRFEQPRAWRP